jgi:hypothetical protein
VLCCTSPTGVEFPIYASLISRRFFWQLLVFVDVECTVMYIANHVVQTVNFLVNQTLKGRSLYRNNSLSANQPRKQLTCALARHVISSSVRLKLPLRGNATEA